jgi:hypothetical protein
MTVHTLGFRQGVRRATASPYSFVGVRLGWDDFIVTGVKATGVALEIYYSI